MPHNPRDDANAPASGGFGREDPLSVPPMNPLLDPGLRDVPLYLRGTVRGSEADVRKGLRGFNGEDGRHWPPSKTHERTPTPESPPGGRSSRLANPRSLLGAGIAVGSAPGLLAGGVLLYRTGSRYRELTQGPPREGRRTWIYGRGATEPRGLLRSPDIDALNYETYTGNGGRLAKDDWLAYGQPKPGSEPAPLASSSGYIGRASTPSPPTVLPVETPPEEKVHGNTAGPQLSWLYRLEAGDNSFLKWGVSQYPKLRYPTAFMKDKFIIPMKQGTRKKMLEMERDLVETEPGPMNFEPWRGARKKKEE